MKKANAKPRPNAPRQQAPWGTCYCAGAGPRLTALTGGVFQGPVFDHFRTAGVEVLLGLRAILDAQIDAMAKRQQRKGTKVSVE